jgi:transposase
MPKYYSKDLRVAALSCISRGETREDIIKFFGISLKTLSNWVRMEREGGEVSPNARVSYRGGDSFRNQLKQVLQENPDLTLDELSERLPKHRTTIFYHLNKLGITRKKNNAIRGAG